MWRGWGLAEDGGPRTLGPQEGAGQHAEGSQLGSEQGLDAGVLTHGLPRRPPRAEPGSPARFLES